MVGRWYAVKAGRVPGIYTTWESCLEQIDRFPGVLFKECNSYIDAAIFMQEVNLVHITGCFRGKDKRSGYAFLYNDTVVYGSLQQISLNQTCLTAAIRALEYIPDRPITLVTDNMYIIHFISRWSKTWVKNGWKTSSGETILNVDLLKKLYYLSQDGVSYKYTDECNICVKDYANRGRLGL